MFTHEHGKHRAVVTVPIPRDDARLMDKKARVNVTLRIRQDVGDVGNAINEDEHAKPAHLAVHGVHQHESEVGKIGDGTRHITQHDNVGFGGSTGVETHVNRYPAGVEGSAHGATHIEPTQPVMPTPLRQRARQLSGERPHGAAHLAQVGRTCRLQVHLFQASVTQGRDGGTKNVVEVIPDVFSDQTTELIYLTRLLGKLEPCKERIRHRIWRIGPNRAHHLRQKARQIRCTKDPVVVRFLATKRAGESCVFVDKSARQCLKGDGIAPLERIHQSGKQIFVDRATVGTASRCGNVSVKLATVGPAAVLERIGRRWTLVCGRPGRRAGWVHRAARRWKGLIKETVKDGTVLDALDHGRPQRDPQHGTVADGQYAERCRGVHLLGQGDGHPGVMQTRKQVKQHGDEPVATQPRLRGGHRLARRLEMSAAALSNSGKYSPRNFFMGTRPTWVPILSAATTRPERPRIGTDSERTPSSNSSSTMQNPAVMTSPMTLAKTSTEVMVRVVRAVKEAVERYRASSSAGKPASNTRPSDVQCAGNRDPSAREIDMMRVVGTRATYTISWPSSTPSDTDSCTFSDSASIDACAISPSCSDDR